MIQNRTIVTMECEYETVPKLSKGTNDLEWPLTQISSSHHYLMLNISETVQDTDIVTMECYLGLTRALPKRVISN